MERREVIGKISEFLKKYKYAAVILLVGIVLMMLPEGKKEDPQPVAAAPAAAESRSLQDSLEEILSQIHGAGKVRVLLTEAQGERTVYQTDTDNDSKDGANRIQQKTVTVTDSSREESGLVRQVNPPVYLGAVVVCQGGDSASIRLAIVEAVSSATGLSSDKITVLKMK